ncbi:MAG: radical SAM protein [Candidatus Parcubacteria bacterium]|nr:radical SAM protein [Candidatus Parcubacteria bacterium]
MANLGYIQLNRTCNQKCLFCSNPENGNVLDFDQAKFYINDFVNKNYQGVIFTGGEPTLNPILPKVIKYAKAKGLEVRIISNGQKIADYQLLKNLQDAGLDLIHVSAYSVSPKIQDYLSQNPGSFKNILKTLINARRLNLPVNINTVINSFNAKSLDKNIKFFLVKFPEINHFVFNNLDPEMNRVEQNKFVVPKLIDFKNSLKRAFESLMKLGKTFRAERVPLCYMADFGEFSTETRKIVKNEERSILFLDNRKDPYSIQKNFFYKKAAQCANCSLNEICAGLYAMDTYYDSEELIPQTFDKDIIINKILRNG